jgi:hypothetical protein
MRLLARPRSRVPPAQNGGLRAPNGGDADLRRRTRLARASRCVPPAQRRSMRMYGLSGLVLADLPVDVVAVLEQQERARQAKRIERPLGKR